MKRVFLLVLIFFSIVLVFLVFYFRTKKQVPQPSALHNSPISPLPTPTIVLPEIPASFTIPLRSHMFQTFNNCGPASLSMQLSYYDIIVSQGDIGKKLRPYQNSAGDNDDKSVTLAELAVEAQNYNLIPYHRPNGSLETLQRFIAEGFPIVIRTWTSPNEDIGHYRVIRGYDISTEEVIQDDSLQGKDLRYTFSYLEAIWKPFNYEYLVLVPKEEEAIAKAILGENIDEKTAWENSEKKLEKELLDDPDNVHTLFNLSVASYHTGNFQKSVEFFEKAETRIPFRTLWYQIEPIRAYYELGDYAKVFSLTNVVLQNGNRAFSELYDIRGNALLKQGKALEADEEFQKALFYNSNYKKD